MSQQPPKKKQKKPAKVAAVALPPSYEELAALHVATLTAASFLAPKGVLCSLPVLQQSVAALTSHALGVEQLQKMVALDASLGLRYAWIAPSPGAPPAEVLELVLREPLKIASSPGAVRSRSRRFRALLEAAASSEPPADLPLAPLPPPSQGSQSDAGDGGGGGYFGASGGDESHHIDDAADAARPLAAATGAVSGLPSPPPKPLRQVGSGTRRAAKASSSKLTASGVMLGREGEGGGEGDEGGGSGEGGGDQAAAAAAVRAAAAARAAMLPVVPDVRPGRPVKDEPRPKYGRRRGTRPKSRPPGL